MSIAAKVMVDFMSYHGVKIHPVRVKRGLEEIIDPVGGKHQQVPA
jgi:hypothetical protein